MSENSDKKWLIAQLKPNAYDLAARNLERQGQMGIEGERGEGGASVDENEEEESGWVRDGRRFGKINKLPGQERRMPEET